MVVAVIDKPLIKVTHRSRPWHFYSWQAKKDFLAIVYSESNSPEAEMEEKVGSSTKSGKEFLSARLFQILGWAPSIHYLGSLQLS